VPDHCGGFSEVGSINLPKFDHNLHEFELETDADPLLEGQVSTMVFGKLFGINRSAQRYHWSRQVARTALQGVQ
jgi:hypothetical protein